MENPDFPRDVHAYLRTLRPPLVFQADELPKTEVQRELQAANADIFESWIANVVENWLAGSTLHRDLSDYKGEQDPTNLFPVLVMKVMFDNFRQFASASNALHVIDKITYDMFISKFSFCRWHKAFDWKPNKRNFPKHKINGVQQQCRRWDMVAIAGDLEINGVVTAPAIKIQAVYRGMRVRHRAAGGMQHADSNAEDNKQSETAPQGEGT
eukprot:429788-Prymnesium_polylepis.2